jgi:hypothetical protein
MVTSDRNRPNRTKRAPFQLRPEGQKAYLSSGFNVFIRVAVGCG